MPIEELFSSASTILAEMQKHLFDKALQMRVSNTVDLNSVAEFRDYFQPDDEQGRSTGGGFARCWFASEEAVQPLLDELKVTIRCIPLDAPPGTGKCFATGQTTNTQAIFAKAY